MGWIELIAHITKINRRDRQIVCVWHPQARGEPFETFYGCVKVEVGQQGYQLTTGERIAI